jgi:hypothetical protein
VSYVDCFRARPMARVSILTHRACSERFSQAVSRSTPRYVRAGDVLVPRKVELVAPPPLALVSGDLRRRSQDVRATIIRSIRQGNLATRGD